MAGTLPGKVSSRNTQVVMCKSDFSLLHNHLHLGQKLRTTSVKIGGFYLISYYSGSTSCLRCTVSFPAISLPIYSVGNPGYWGYLPQVVWWNPHFSFCVFHNQVSDCIWTGDIYHVGRVMIIWLEFMNISKIQIPLWYCWDLLWSLHFLSHLGNMYKCW